MVGVGGDIFKRGGELHIGQDVRLGLLVHPPPSAESGNTARLRQDQEGGALCI